MAKPPPDTKLALHVFYFYMHGLASADDVIEAAGKLSVEELTNFKLVSVISYPPELAEENVLPILGRLP